MRQAEIYGFVEIEGLIFGETSSVVIDPGEEKLKSEFAWVALTLVPMHAVIRVDEVQKGDRVRSWSWVKRTTSAFPQFPVLPLGKKF